MKDRSLEGAGQVYGRGRAEVGAVKEQESSKAGIVHTPNFIKIVEKTLKNTQKQRSQKDSLLVGFELLVQ